MNRSLPNYIRTHRRRAFLSQDEVAFLLGAGSATTVVRHETGERQPTLERGLAYAAILQVDPRQLFAGSFEDQQRAARLRAAELLRKVKEEPRTEAVCAKVLWLETLVHDPEPHLVPCEEE